MNAEHVQPVLDALPEEIRGDIYAPQNVACDVDGPVRMGAPPDGTLPIICAGYQDTTWTHRPKVLVNHGAGQTYRDCRHGSYAGGPGRDMVDLFLHPNERCAALDRERYPRARSVAVGCPKLDVWQRIPRPHNDLPVIAVTFHWPAYLVDDKDRPVPEAGWVFEEWKDRIAELVRMFPGCVLGHGHPRAQRFLRPFWDECGVEFVPRAEDLLVRADCLVLDNSSLGFEWAALDRSTVWLRSASWRPDDVSGHGLRFGERLPGPDLWPSAPVSELVDVINTSLRWYVLARMEVGHRVYGDCLSGAAGRAAAAVQDLIARPEEDTYEETEK